ncbi:MAG: signal recognition particle protein [Verrucomicrobiota bacterium]
MLTVLGEKLQGVFKHVRGYGKLTESNIADALKEVRLALLAADVNYGVARDFCNRVKEQALGEEFQKSIRPGDMFVKVVHDELINIFNNEGSSLSDRQQAKIAMCGLNGAGKTTTSAKLALYLKKKQRKSVLLVAADLSRPAAIEQLETLGQQIEVPVFSPEPGSSLKQHIQKALGEAKSRNVDVTLFDTAGRTEANDELLKELKEVMALIEPDECLLVADAAMGQQAAEVASRFREAAPISGLILSKFDGDARGGAALSLQTLTDCPIKFLGSGEKVEALEEFDPSRLVDRMLGMGDIVGLVEQAQDALDLEDAERLQEKLKRQQFDLQDFLDQMRQMKKLGPMQNILGMIPGMGNISGSFEEGTLVRTEAIICSMTKQERRRPEVLNARRRQRIALGSGTQVRDVNELLKRFKGMKKMMGKLTRGGNMEAKLKKMLGNLGGLT